MNRRTFFATAAFAALPFPTLALSEDDASILVNSVVEKINRIIESGKPDDEIIRDFEDLFAVQSDLAVIARSTLGPVARTIPRSQLDAYQEAFKGYIARKYGRRFRDFTGTKIELAGTFNRGRYYEVSTIAYMPSVAPINIVFRVSDRSGKILFFDMLVEGISLLTTERQEIGSLLDQSGGDVDEVIRRLANYG